VLRLSDAKRRASALKASSYLRRLSGVFLLFSALLTQELYMLLLHLTAEQARKQVENDRQVEAGRKGSRSGASPRAGRALTTEAEG
jgi:hypothetical protein